MMTTTGQWRSERCPDCHAERERWWVLRDGEWRPTRDVTLCLCDTP